MTFTEHANSIPENFGNSLARNAGVTRFGSNNKLYFQTPNGGVFKGNKYVSTNQLSNYGKELGQYATRFGYVITIAQVGYGVYKDGGKFRTNSQIATGGAIGGWAGAELGAAAGAQSGAAIGGTIGVWFYGVGAAPGAAIGAIIGGTIGGVSGAYYGSKYGEDIVKNIQN